MAGKRRFKVTYEFEVNEGDMLEGDNLFAYSADDWSENTTEIFRDGATFDYLPNFTRLKVEEIQ